jgi:DNA repair protein RAD7
VTDICLEVQTSDFKLIATRSPLVKDLTLRWCGQVKDEVIDHWIDNFKQLERVHLEGANLVSNDAWQRFFSKFGAGLVELRLSWLDHAFNEDTTAMMVTCCPNLRVLKLKKVWKMGRAGLKMLGQLENLEVLTLLDRTRLIEAEDLVELVTKIGPKLTTLSLLEVQDSDDTVLRAIHEHCHRLRTLKLTKNDLYTSQGFIELFKDWKSTGLEKLNVEYCCNMDTEKPLVNTAGIGFDDDPLTYALIHSGHSLKNLNLKGDRHITRASLEVAFDGRREFPNLSEIDLGFIGDVNDILLKQLERSCPALDRIWVSWIFLILEILF